MEIIAEVKPTQATLVPDGPDVLTSNAGWNTIKNASLLKEITNELKKCGARVSIFVDPDVTQIEGVAEIGADRIELYTEPYAANFMHNHEIAIDLYVKAALRAKELGIEVNAGHDLDLRNLSYLKKKIPFLAEVSIGHALVCDALYYGLENAIQMYLRELNK